MNPHAYIRRASGKKRGNFRVCKYCLNSSVRGQGLCHECSHRTKEENKQHLAIVNAKLVLDDFLLQKNISAKNLKTIKGFCDFADPTLHQYATLVLEIGQRFPRKKKRYRRIKQSEPGLDQRLRQNSNFYWLDNDMTELDDCDESHFAF